MKFTSWLGQKIGLNGESAKRFWASFAGGQGLPPVTPARAMNVAAFWRGVRLKAETIGTLPPSSYILDPSTGRGVLDRTSQYDTLARVTPNEYQTPVEFWEGMVGAQAVVGNGYARKLRIGKRVVALEPMDPDPCVTHPWRNSQNELRYRGRDWYGNVFPDLAPEDVFHLKGFGFGGDCGLSTVAYGAQTFQLALAGNKVASQTFASGLSGNGFIETGQVLDEPDRVRLNEILKQYQADEGFGKMMILEGGMKYNKLSLTSLDAQLLATLGYSIEEIGRWLGMPPILLGHAGDGQTMWGTGVESIIQSWYNLGLRADITRVEKAWQKRVIDPKDQSSYYLKFNVNGLLRGDTQTRALVEAQQAQNGLRTRDELRANDDLGPIPGGDVATAQTNLAPLDQLGQAFAAGGAAGAGDQLANALRAMIEGVLRDREMDDLLAANRARFIVQPEPRRIEAEPAPARTPPAE